MLQRRRDDSRKRLEAARQAVAAEESNLAKWQAALDLELGSTAKANGNGKGDTASLSHGSVTSDAELLASPRVKRELFMKRLREAGRPMRTTELIKAIPELSERYIYYVLGDLKKSGELEVDKKTKGFKLAQNGSAVKAEPPVAAGGHSLRTGGDSDTTIGES
jgi:hypothetical protein